MMSDVTWIIKDPAIDDAFKGFKWALGQALPYGTWSVFIGREDGFTKIMGGISNAEMEPLSQLLPPGDWHVWISGQKHEQELIIL